MSFETLIPKRVYLMTGDCIVAMRAIETNSIDAIVTDPPYGIEFMGKEFDSADGFRRSLNEADVSRENVFGRTSARGPEYRTESNGKNLFQEWCTVWAIECLRVLKPGGHMLAFGGTRTYHRLACAVEDAGFEIRDQIQWIYGSGFPKSNNVSKRIDKEAGAVRESVRYYNPRNPKATGSGKDGMEGATRPWIVAAMERGYHEKVGDVPGTDAAKQWNGFGTALKPAHEPIILARKPLIGTVAENILCWGTGAINIDGCRIHADDAKGHAYTAMRTMPGSGQNKTGERHQKDVIFSGMTKDGRWPANIIHDGSDEVVAAFPAQSSVTGKRTQSSQNAKVDGTNWLSDNHKSTEHTDSGSPSRFYASFPQDDNDTRHGEPSADRRYTDNGSTNFAATPGPRGGSPMGRWPANVITDGSDEVASAFPETSSGSKDCVQNGWGENGIYGKGKPHRKISVSNSGSAARFFYSAKAGPNDRLGSKHPTVKPIALMRYLCRLITPPGGLILDPFAGTGTTAEAAYLEGMKAVLIEKEADYQADIRKRMSLVNASKDERKRVVAASKKQMDSGPLFADRNES